MLKKYDELTEEEKKKVSIMYSDKDTVQNYLYNFDGEKYIGRQYVPPEAQQMAKDIASNHGMDVKDAAEILTDALNKEVTGKTEPVKKVSRKSKK